jgi:hypothetical protein
MTDRALVLVLSNDLSLAATKTSRHLTLALQKCGFQAVCRDTSLVRWAIGASAPESEARRKAYEVAVVAKWNKFVNDYGIDLIVSLDLHWLLSSQLFLENDKVRAIHSFWFDDLRSCLQSAPVFPLDPRTAPEVIADPKVTHHCYGAGQAEELRLLGIRRVTPSPLAAPAEMLKAEAACTRRDRLGFVGNPGLPVPPTPEALAAMERGENLAALRCLARHEILAALTAGEPTASWVRESPGVLDLLAAATQERLVRPNVAAISLLLQAGTAYPEAYDFLNRHGHILDAAFLVKLVNRYDRPALVRRLWKRGWLEVHGTPEQWQPYGINAQPTVPFPSLPEIYRRYPAQLNAPNCARDASANEKLFEIAACARLSLNLDSPDVRACYSEGEVVLAESEEALDAAAEEVLRDPEAALARGENARRRTAAEHLWENRIGKALA